MNRLKAMFSDWMDACRGWDRFDRIISRSEFWFDQVPLVIAFILDNILMMPMLPVLNWIGLAVGIFLIVVEAALMTRRLRDVGFSPLWLVIVIPSNVVPIVGGILDAVTVFIMAMPTDEAYKIEHRLRKK